MKRTTSTPWLDDDRRTFLGSTLAANAVLLAARARADEPPKCDLPPIPMMGQQKKAPAYPFPRIVKPRMRRSLHEVAEDPSALADLKKAYGALKKLPAQDNRSWCNQANLHYKHCSFPAQQPGDKLPYHLQVHFGWYFLPWHRAYLYFYESILAKLLGKDDFALPYWDWTQHPTLPDALFDAASPLFHKNRTVKKGDSIVNDPDTFDVTRRAAIDALLAIPYFYAPIPGLTGSFGGPPDGLEASGFLQGALEAGPHNAIHNYVGGDMGDFDTAARDILFFAHHANVDKLWADWLLIAGHTNPASQTWLTQWFNFYDPSKGEEVSVTVADTIDFTRVNVLYQPYRPAAVRKALGALAAARPLTLEGKPQTVTARMVLPQTRALAAPLPARRTRLVIEDFHAPGDAALRIRVFLSEEATAKTPLTDPSYAGTVFIVPMHGSRHGKKMGAEHAPPTRNLALDITDRRGALAAGTPVKVTLVPVDRQGNASKAKVTFKGVAVVVDR